MFTVVGSTQANFCKSFFMVLLEDIHSLLLQLQLQRVYFSKQNLNPNTDFDVPTIATKPGQVRGRPDYCNHQGILVLSYKAFLPNWNPGVCLVGILLERGTAGTVCWNCRKYGTVVVLSDTGLYCQCRLIPNMHFIHHDRKIGVIWIHVSWIVPHLRANLKSKLL